MSELSLSPLCEAELVNPEANLSFHFLPSPVVKARFHERLHHCRNAAQDFRTQLSRFIPGQVPATGSATTLAPVRALRLRVSPVDRAVVEADRVGKVLAVT